MGGPRFKDLSNPKFAKFKYHILHRRLCGWVGPGEIRTRASWLRTSESVQANLPAPSAGNLLEPT